MNKRKLITLLSTAVLVTVTAALGFVMSATVPHDVEKPEEQIVSEAWTLTYKIHYYRNGATGGWDDDTIGYGSDKGDDVKWWGIGVYWGWWGSWWASGTVSGNGFTYPGYTFTGWNTSADGNGTAYAPGDSISASNSGKGDYADSPGDQTLDSHLYAQWSLDYYTITLETESDTLEPGENWTDISPSTAAKTKYGVKYSIQGR